MHEWLLIALPLGVLVLTYLKMRVEIALLVGCVLGALLFAFSNPSSPYGMLASSIKYLTSALVKNLIDADHLKVIFFTLFMTLMVRVMQEHSSFKALIVQTSARLKNARQAQMLTYWSGLLIFFDDYLSVMFAGKLACAINEKFRVRKAKIAYIIDSTSAPIASVSLVSTWIGYELSQIQDALDRSQISIDAMELFVSGLTTRFYPLVTIVFVWCVIRWQLHIPPMPKHNELFVESFEEEKSTSTVTHRNKGSFVRALAPLWALMASLALVLVFSLNPLRGVIEWWQSPEQWLLHPNVDSLLALVVVSAIGLGIALIQSLRDKSHETNPWSVLFKTTKDTLQELKPLVLVLVLAWSFSTILNELGLGALLADRLSDVLSIRWLPFATFIISALVAFSMGSSWATMAIVFPVLVPIAHYTSSETELYNVLAYSCSAVLSGAVLGDHISPISDTTILSSIAAEIEVREHVRTQTPYALVAAGIVIVGGYCPLAFGLSITWVWVSLLALLSMSVAFIHLRSKASKTGL